METIEDDLESIYSNIIFLIYKSKCIWSDDHLEIPCDGSLNLTRLIPESDLRFKWDLNNSIILCDNHKDWWQQDPDSRLIFLKDHSRLSNFTLDNQTTPQKFEPDLEALKLFLVENSNECIKKGAAPFPSLYGKFDV